MDKRISPAAQAQSRYQGKKDTLLSIAVDCFIVLTGEIIQRGVSNIAAFWQARRYI
jgi:hypothetical protein